jgi:hypothetical protein
MTVGGPVLSAAAIPPATKKRTATLTTLRLTNPAQVTTLVLLEGIGSAGGNPGTRKRFGSSGGADPSSLEGQNARPPAPSNGDS